MKNFIYLFMTVAAFTLSGCSKEDDSTGTPVTEDDIDVVDDTNDDDTDDDTDDTDEDSDDTDEVGELTGDSETFNLQSVLDPDVSGAVTFKKHESGATTIEISLEGTSEGTYPVHLHKESIDETGALAINLNNVDGSTGISTTVVTSLDDGTPIEYEELIVYDGYIAVYRTADFDGHLAKGDIGINLLTGESITYNLNSLTEDGIEGTATIHERVSGAALVEINLDGTTSGNSYPAHIHFNSAEEGGSIAVNLNAINGGPGTSATHLEMLNDDTPITYDELLVYDGHINVHLSVTEMGTIVSQGNIGINAAD